MFSIDLMSLNLYFCHVYIIIYRLDPGFMNKKKGNLDVFFLGGHIFSCHKGSVAINDLCSFKDSFQLYWSMLVLCLILGIILIANAKSFWGLSTNPQVFTKDPLGSVWSVPLITPALSDTRNLCMVLSFTKCLCWVSWHFPVVWRIWKLSNNLRIFVCRFLDLFLCESLCSKMSLTFSLLLAWGLVSL